MRQVAFLAGLSLALHAFGIDGVAAQSEQVRVPAPSMIEPSQTATNGTVAAERQQQPKPEGGDVAPDPADNMPIDPSRKGHERKAKPTTEDICSVIAENADRVRMDRDFFARLIWKESRFDVGALSPVGAQGIAQFMPYTAKERGLEDPNDYVEAIAHSALYLRDLKSELGNWGLAAAAYNGGINRMKGWIRRGARGILPSETVDYVNAITYRPIEWFLEEGRDVEKRPLDSGRSFMEACARLPIMKTRSVFAASESPAVRQQPWGVQVAGHANRSVAMKMFGRVRASYSSLIGGKQPMVVRSRAGGGPRIYAVRIGADSRNEANTVCGRLRQSGGSCIVVKN